MRWEILARVSLEADAEAGAEFRYYPAQHSVRLGLPLSQRDRHTIMNVSVRFKNYTYAMPQSVEWVIS